MSPVALVMSLALSACSRMPDWTQLNDPATSIWAADPTALGDDRDILVEEKHDANWSVTYNLSQWDEGVTGFRLVLKIRNLSSAPANAAPVIKLLTADGVVLAVADRRQLLEFGEELAGTSIPATQIDRSAPSGGFAGGFSQGFDNGTSRGEHNRAVIRASDGRRLIALASTSWLQPSVSLDPQEATVGALFYQAPAREPLPLRLKVTIGASSFEFTTRARGDTGSHMKVYFGGRRLQ
ncbi:MAG: hypothetical protein ACHP84_01730 [Caulobacterales bacterium]